MSADSSDSPRPAPTLRFEKRAVRRGATLVAGVDEAGRGPLAGPVVVAAVILNRRRIPVGLNDSKVLTANARADLYDEIIATSTVSVVAAPTSIIARLKQSIGCISSAMAYLHSQSIRHKDIKPNNMLLSSAGIWVADFGSSTDFSEISQSVTANGERGTPKYFAPEVAAYEANGRSADIFSLGCVFLEMLGLCNGHSLEFMRELRPDKDRSFHANLGAILHWFNFSGTQVDSFADGQLMALVREMIGPDPQARPTAESITARLQLVDVFRRPSPPPPLWGSCCAPRRISARDIVEGRQVAAVTARVGNQHRQQGQEHAWRFFVNVPGLESIIDNLHFFLVSSFPLSLSLSLSLCPRLVGEKICALTYTKKQHSSFTAPYTIMHQPPFELSGSGWGYFPIGVVVSLRRGYAWVAEDAMVGPEGQSLLPLYWMLNFERDLSFTDVDVGVVDIRQ